MCKTHYKYSHACSSVIFYSSYKIAIICLCFLVLNLFYKPNQTSTLTTQKSYLSPKIQKMSIYFLISVVWEEYNAIQYAYIKNNKVIKWDTNIFISTPSTIRWPLLLMGVVQKQGLIDSSCSKHLHKEIKESSAINQLLCPGITSTLPDIKFSAYFFTWYQNQSVPYYSLLHSQQ